MLCSNWIPPSFTPFFSPSSSAGTCTKFSESTAGLPTSETFIKILIDVQKEVILLTEQIHQMSYTVPRQYNLNHIMKLKTME